MDNLPIPQSRIEELMNAFISRDSSRISTPQSRIEEFWYHLIEGTNALPIPQSRIELLLKKIIENDTQQIPLAQSRAEEFLVSILTGDTDKLPIPQSRSEYYLDYIARNNLVLDDIEYLKYNGTNITATNTVQKPFRSAILKGQTLVNLVPRKIIDHIASSDWDGYCCLVQNSKQSFDQWRTLQDLKPNTKYYISCYVETFEDANNKDYCLNNPSVESIFEDSMIINGVGRYQWLSTTKSELTDEIFIVLRSQNAHARGAIKIRDIMIIEYQEGMKNWDIPYFEGMQSVKMPVLKTTGKNLFDMNRPYDAITDSQATVVQDTNQITVSSSDSGTYVSANFILDKDFFAGKTVTGSCLYESDIKDIGTVQISYQDGNGDHHYQWIKTPKTFTFPNNFIGDVVLCVCANNTGTPQSNTVTVKNIQLELGSVATSYEPHKSNILTVNEDVTLRSNGDICDELNLLTGQLTQRIGEDGVVLSQEVVKTVDLKVVDQDDNPVKQLSAFDETTHIVSSSASDNSLIAIAEVEVPTKLIEALDNIKLLSSDVGMLIDEVDAMQKTQDENSTMTMMAMTEVFEMVLMQSPMALNSKNRKVDTTMVEVYVTLILKGKKTVEQVPTVIRPRVEAMLKELGVNAE